MIFPSLASAEEYLKEQLQLFYDQGAILQDRIVSIAKLKRKARESNNQQTMGQLVVADQQARELFQEHLELRNKLAPFGEYFQVRMNLGFLPLILGATAIAAAGAMYLHFEKLRNQKKALDLIANGMLSPAEADSIMNPSMLSSLVGGGMMGMLPLALVGVLAYFVILKR